MSPTLSELPLDALTVILRRVPRRQHARLATVCTVFRAAIVRQHRSVLRVVDLFPFARHHDVAPLLLNGPVVESLRNLVPRVAHAGAELRELRLHAGVNALIRNAALGRACERCPALQRLAFADGNTVSAVRAGTVIRAFPALTHIELGQCASPLLGTLSLLPPTCTTVSLHADRSVEFLAVLASLIRLARLGSRRRASLDFHVYLCAYPDLAGTLDAATQFMDGLCALTADDLDAISTLTLSVNLSRDVVGPVETLLKPRYQRSTGAAWSRDVVGSTSPIFLPFHAAMRIECAPHHSMFYPAAISETCPTIRPAEVVNLTQPESLSRHSKEIPSLRGAHTVIVGRYGDWQVPQTTHSSKAAVDKFVESGSDGSLHTVHVNVSAWNMHDVSYVAAAASIMDRLCRGTSSVRTVRLSSAVVLVLSGVMWERMRGLTTVECLQLVWAGHTTGGLATRRWDIWDAQMIFDTSLVSLFCIKLDCLLSELAVFGTRLSVIGLEYMPAVRDPEKSCLADVKNTLRNVDAFCEKMPGTDITSLRDQLEAWLWNLGSENGR